jgi:signal transduction histidine kinase
MNTFMNVSNELQIDGYEPTPDVMRNYAMHLLIAREKERWKLANEIHDKLGQNLLALRIDISMLHARTTETHPLINSKAANYLNEIDIAIQNIRSIINRLHPPVVKLGLLAAVEWKIKEFEKQGIITCTLEIEGDEQEFVTSSRNIIAVVRLLDEALTNAVRHGQANTSRIVLSNFQGMLTIKIYDDGIGIQASDLNKPNAYGLIGIREYAQILRGSFSIGPNPEKGTVLTIQIPAGGNSKQE